MAGRRGEGNASGVMRGEGAARLAACFGEQKQGDVTDCPYFVLVFLAVKFYLSLSYFHYESLPNGEVMDTFDRWLIIHGLANRIKVSLTDKGRQWLARHADG